jgi:NitT/TauT family transport system substrate-binding protein
MFIFTSARKAAGVIGAASALCLMTACGGGGDASGDSGSGKTDTVTVQLDYQPRGNHGMFFVARELGYFEQEGIKVEDIKTGTGSADALRLVGTGRADFGFGDLPTLVTSRTQNVPVKAIAAVNQTSPLGMCTVKDKVPLKSPEDLKGLTVGIHPAGSTFIFYKALLSANGIDRGALREVTVKPPYENYLLQGRVQTVPCYIDAEVPLLQQHAGGEGSLDILLGSDAGYQAYGSGLFTSDKMIQEKPDLVQRFTNAYLKAFDYTVKNPEKVAEILAKSSPEQAENGPLFQKQLQADIDHTFTSDTTKAHGLGAMDPAMWKTTIDTLAAQNVLEGNAPAVDDVYDATFVDAYNGKH